MFLYQTFHLPRRRLRHQDVVMDEDVVVPDRDAGADVEHAELVPLAGRLRGVGERLETAIDGSRIVVRDLAPVAVEHLHLDGPPQVNAAVAVLRDPVLELELVVLELVDRARIVHALRFVREGPVLDGPAVLVPVLALGVDPARGVLPVEDRDPLPEVVALRGGKRGKKKRQNGDGRASYHERSFR
jgi:hypothetical protein